MTVHAALEQRIAIIGGATGIGLAVARKLGAQGHRIVIGSRSLQARSDALDSMSIHHHITGAFIDVGQSDIVGEFFTHHGPFDRILISAGGFVAGSPTDVSMEDLMLSIKTRVVGLMNCYRYVSGIGAEAERPRRIVVLGAATYDTHVAAAVANGALKSLVNSLNMDTKVITRLVTPPVTTTRHWDVIPGSARLPILATAHAADDTATDLAEELMA